MGRFSVELAHPCLRLFLSLLVLTGIAVPRSTMAQAVHVPIVFFLCGDERSDAPVDFADRINQYTSVSVLAVRPPPTVDVQEARAREKWRREQLEPQ